MKLHLRQPRTESPPQKNESRHESIERDRPTDESDSDMSHLDDDVILSPPKRHSQRDSNPANQQHHKCRAQRMKRRIMLKRVRLYHSSKKPDIPHKKLLKGFSCPYCTKLPIHTYAQNVKQHIQAKHRDKKQLSVEELVALHAEKGVTDKKGGEELVRLQAEKGDTDNKGEEEQQKRQ